MAISDQFTWPLTLLILDDFIEFKLYLIVTVYSPSLNLTLPAEKGGVRAYNSSGV